MLEYTRPTKNIWFTDQREPVYDPHDPISDYQFKEYWKRERDRCINGFKIADGKVTVTGWLYFHTVYGTIVRYVTNSKTKRKVRKKTQPLLRDIEWDIINIDFPRCEEEGKFYALVGSRDFGKSIIAASRAAWIYTFFDDSECVISGGEDKFIKLATDKIEDILTNLHPIFKKQRLSSDWKKEVKAGWKDKKTNQPHEKSSQSRILVRNYDGGTQTMAANGTRPQFHLIDEIGTIPNLIGCIKDSDGCWWSGGGAEVDDETGVDPSDVSEEEFNEIERDPDDKPSCIPMFTGTGGDMEVGAEAGEIFFNPEPYNILEFENPEEIGKKMGRFVTALRARMKFKERWTLAQYLNIDHPDLDKITILVSNEERALKEWWEPTYQKARKSGNQKTITKFLAYWPTKPSHSFLVINKNDFNVEAATNQKRRLQALGSTGTPIELYHDGERIVHKFTDKVPITQFPLKDQDPEGCVVMYEAPIKNAPYGLYIFGVDPYKQDTSKYSDSLGSIYIYKRMHSIMGEQFQDMFVAQYVGRPNSIVTWNETVRNLIKYYNAVGLSENEDYGFINHMVNKGDSMYLMEQPDWLKDITPNSSLIGRRQYGIPATPKIIAHLNGLLKSYTEEVVSKEIDENGSVVKEILGFSKILDPMLLEEIIKFNTEGNFDRIRAASIAIAIAKHLDAQKIMVSTVETDPRMLSYLKKNKPSGTSMLLGKSSPPSKSNKKTKIKRLFS